MTDIMTDIPNTSLGDLVSDMESPLRDAAGLARAIYAMTAYPRLGLDQKDAEALAVVATHLLADLEVLGEAWQRSFDMTHRPAA